MSVSKILITGFISQNAELKKSKNGNSLLVFNVACNYGSQENRTSIFYSVCMSANNYLTQLESFTKGALVIVIGNLTISSFTAKDGSIKLDHKIFASDIEFLRRNKDLNKDNSSSNNEEFEKNEFKKNRDKDIEDHLPF